MSDAPGTSMPAALNGHAGDCNADGRWTLHQQSTDDVGRHVTFDYIAAYFGGIHHDNV